jgi:hypothetical protein
MPRQIPPEIRTKLDDKDWLIENHVQNLISISELSTQLSVTPGVVRKALRLHCIVSPSQQSLREASNIRKYGVKNTGALPAVRAKAAETMQEKFGGHNWSEGNRDARDATCLERYGNVNVGKTEFARDKAKQTNQALYGRDHVNQTHLSDLVIRNLKDRDWMYDQHITKKKSLRQVAFELGFGNDMTTVMRHLHSHNITTVHHSSSFGENQLAEFVERLGVTIERNNRTLISPKELDIYIPSHDLAIEYCGVYWHSEGMGKGRNYHKQKYEACAQQGIRLLTIFDSEWETDRSIVEAKLIAILGLATERVYARMCSIIEISHSQKKEFLNKHHIQGTGPGSITYGLEYEGDVVAVMTFISTQKEVILNRYATSINVVGGFSKLLKQFQRNHEWSRLVSFADQRWSNGEVYARTGWTLEHTTHPEYMYIIGNQPQHKFAFRRRALEKKLANFDPQLSEWENMKAHGYDRIWDCGKLRFVLTNPT